MVYNARCKTPSLKPQPNDRNISTQHIPTLLAQHLQAPAKRSQHYSTTYPTLLGATCCVRLAILLQCVGTWVLKIELVCMPGCNIVARTWPNDHNIMQHPQMFHVKFDQFQIILSQQHPTCRKTLQHGGQTLATCCTKQCCDMLRWNVAIVWTGLKTYSQGATALSWKHMYHFYLRVFFFVSTSQCSKEWVSTFLSEVLKLRQALSSGPQTINIMTTWLVSPDPPLCQHLPLGHVYICISFIW